MSTIAEHEMPENPAMKIQFLHRQELSAPLSLKHAALTADTWQHRNDLLGVLCIKTFSFYEIVLAPYQIALKMQSEAWKLSSKTDWN